MFGVDEFVAVETQLRLGHLQGRRSLCRTALFLCAARLRSSCHALAVRLSTSAWSCCVSCSSCVIFCERTSVSSHELAVLRFQSRFAYAAARRQRPDPPHGPPAVRPRVRTHSLRPTLPTAPVPALSARAVDPREIVPRQGRLFCPSRCQERLSLRALSTSEPTKLIISSAIRVSRRAAAWFCQRGGSASRTVWREPQGEFATLSILVRAGAKLYRLPGSISRIQLSLCQSPGR